MGAVVIARGIPRVQDLQAVGLLPVQRWCRRPRDWVRETVHWCRPMLPCWQLMRAVADSGVRDCQTTTAWLYIDTSLVDLYARVTFWFALITFDVTLAAGRASVDMSGRSLETRTPCKESGAAELPHGVMFLSPVNLPSCVRPEATAPGLPISGTSLERRLADHVATRIR
jgi:hypothetical protein